MISLPRTAAVLALPAIAGYLLLSDTDDASPSSGPSSLPVRGPLGLGLLVLFASLPFWLPGLVVSIRMFLFTKLNGDQGVQFPNSDVGADQFKALYANKNAKIRSRQKNVGLSDLFWYFLCPGPDIHQEHVETGTHLHSMVHLGTKLMLTVPTERVEALAAKACRIRFCSEAGMRELGFNPASAASVSSASDLGVGVPNWSIVRLRDMFFPTFARFWYELLFDEEPSEHAIRLIVASGQNVINALKATELRDMAARNALTDFVREKMEGGALAEVVEAATKGMTPQERALHVQGVFFHTGCVQMSEAMAHTALALAQHPEFADRLAHDTDGVEMDLFLTEVLRCWPLFGIAHRIASAPISIPGTSGKPVAIPEGTVMCFNYPAYHSVGYDKPSSFLPDRWRTLSKKDANYLPFGSMRNRPCPGQRVALLVMKEMTKVIVERAQFRTAVRHDRSLPGRGICLVMPRTPVDAKGTGLAPSTSSAPSSSSSSSFSSSSSSSPSSSPSSSAPSTSMSALPAVHSRPQFGVTPQLWRMRLTDTIDNVTRSVVQLFVGTYLVIDAKRQRLARTYQEGQTPRGPRPDYHTKPAPPVVPSSVARGASSPPASSPGASP